MNRGEKLSNLYFDKIYTGFRVVSVGMDMRKVLQHSIKPMAGGLMVISPSKYPTADYFFAWQKRKGITGLEPAIKAFTLACIARAALEDREEEQLGLDEKGRYALRLQRFRDCNSSRFRNIFRDS